MDEMVKDFLIESGENLDRLDQELVKLESSPSSQELLASVFRTIHTIKGSCGFLGFARLEKLTHAGENLLSRLRDGQLVLTADITSGLLAMVDAVRQMLGAIRETGTDGNEDYAQLIEPLAKLQENPLAIAASSLPSAPVQEVTPTPSSASETTAPLVADPSKIGGVLLERGQVSPADLAQALQQQEAGRKRMTKS